MIRPDLTHDLISEGWYGLQKVLPFDPIARGEILVEIHFVAPAHAHIRIQIEDFEILKVLGKGHFGKVMMVKKKDTGALYAMKSVKKEELVKRGGLP